MTENATSEQIQNWKKSFPMDEVADSSSLNCVQRWMQLVITHPDGVQSGVASNNAVKLIDVSVSDLERVILPSREMTSLDRLEIYGRAYFGRLIECLQAQFPSTRQAISDEAFDAIAFGYLSQNPSQRYTLANLGNSFDAFLASTRPARADSNELDFADFLIDLARLERIYAEVFSGRGPENDHSLEATNLDGMTADQFAGCQLVPHACVRLLEFGFPVHEYASAVRKGAEPAPPLARSTLLVVTRRNYVVRRYEVTRPQFDLLSSLIRGETIGTAVAGLIAKQEMNVESAANELRDWFREWSAAPLFSAVIPDPHSQ